MARILQEQGYIEGWSVERARVGETLRVRLKYTDSRGSVISGIRRVSKPGRRTYVASPEVPRVLGGMGTAIISTSHGLMTGHDARRQRPEIRADVRRVASPGGARAREQADDGTATADEDG